MADRSVRQENGGSDASMIALRREALAMQERKALMQRGLVVSVADTLADWGAGLGAYRLDSVGRVRRAKTLDELDMDAGTQWDSVPYAMDDSEVFGCL